MNLAYALGLVFFFFLNGVLGIFRTFLVGFQENKKKLFRGLEIFGLGQYLMNLKMFLEQV